MSKRLSNIFLKKEKKLVTFVTGGDPDKNTSEAILNQIIVNGADIIEIGMPFSDPMADGPTIQMSSNRAIKKGVNLQVIFDICKNIRKKNNDIPIVLMGYYNVILHFGLSNFINNCLSVGIDGLIIVDLQPEEDTELYKLTKLNNINLIRLITPNSTDDRIQTITNHASGFLYYVTITGITGQKSADMNNLKNSINNIRKYSNLPIVAGFGINNKLQVNEVCKSADGAVVGSSLVKIIEKNLDKKEQMINLIGKFVKDLKGGTKI